MNKKMSIVILYLYILGNQINPTCIQKVHLWELCTCFQQVFHFLYRRCSYMSLYKDKGGDTLQRRPIILQWVICWLIRLNTVVTIESLSVWTGFKFVIQQFRRLQLACSHPVHLVCLCQSFRNHFNRISSERLSSSE